MLDKGSNYAWNGTEWIELGFIIDMSEFAYQDEVNEIKTVVNENADKIENLNGVVVYENATGGNGDIEFFKSIANCKYIDVEYSAWGGFSTKRFYEPVEKTCFIDGMVFSNNNSSYNFVHSYSINDLGMTLKTYSGAFLRDYTTGAISGFQGANGNVKIHKVICYY